MRFHWYFPFARPEELDWAQHTTREGESIVLQVIDRAQAVASGTHGPVQVIRDLPDVDRAAPPVRWLDSRARTYLTRSRRRRAMWRNTAFDLVHLHYLNRFTDSRVRVTPPLVLSVHDVFPHRMRLGRAERVVLRRTYARGDALVVHHEMLRDQLIAEFPVDPARVHVVPHQVFPTNALLNPPSSAIPTVLFFGALRANKGLEVLLQSMSRIDEPNLRLVIAGRGDPAVEALALRAAEADGRISAEVGFVPLPRKQELFSQASIAVLPYTSFASQSGVLHDAYGHGRPVVVTDVGALGRTVREDRTGLIAAVGDPEDLANKILLALEPNRWRSLADATNVVRLARTPKRTGERLREVYDTVLG